VNPLPHSKTLAQRHPACRKAQSAQIARVLIEACGAWVPLPEIMACAAQYNARLHELRRLGFTIENRVERDEAGVVHSWYRLVNSPALESAKSEDPKPVKSGRSGAPAEAQKNIGGNFPAGDSLTDLENRKDWYVEQTGKPRPRTADLPLFSQESAR
jgi:hypothetical protein